MRVIFAAPTVAVVMHAPIRLLVEILSLKLDRLPVRRAIRRMIPSVLIAGKRRGVGHALLGDEALERIEPVAVVGLAGVGIACALSALDLFGQRRRPLRPCEQPALV